MRRQEHTHYYAPRRHYPVEVFALDGHVVDAVGAGDFGDGGGGDGDAAIDAVELRPYLEECFELAEPGTEHVITMCRNSGKNCRTHMERISKRAGVKPWPKLFVNLRSTRETELAEVFPMHVVCAWIGNSQAVAAKHYLQTTDDHYARALHMRCSKPQNGPAQARNTEAENEENPLEHCDSGGSGNVVSGRYWIRTSDPCDVNTVL